MLRTAIGYTRASVVSAVKSSRVLMTLTLTLANIILQTWKPRSIAQAGSLRLEKADTGVHQDR